MTNRRGACPACPDGSRSSVGLSVLSLVNLPPYVGPFVNLAAVIFSLGRLVLALRSHLSARADMALRFRAVVDARGSV